MRLSIELFIRGGMSLPLPAGAGGGGTVSCCGTSNREHFTINLSIVMTIVSFPFVICDILVRGHSKLLKTAVQPGLESPDNWGAWLVLSLNHLQYSAKNQ